MPFVVQRRHSHWLFRTGIDEVTRSEHDLQFVLDVGTLWIFDDVRYIGQHVEILIRCPFWVHEATHDYLCPALFSRQFTHEMPDPRSCR